MLTWFFRSVQEVPPNFLKASERKREKNFQEVVARSASKILAPSSPGVNPQSSCDFSDLHGSLFQKLIKLYKLLLIQNVNESKHSSLTLGVKSKIFNKGKIGEQPISNNLL